MREVIFKFKQERTKETCQPVVDWLNEQEMYHFLYKTHAGRFSNVRVLECDAALFKLRWGDEVTQFMFTRDLGRGNAGS